MNKLNGRMDQKCSFMTNFCSLTLCIKTWSLSIAITPTTQTLNCKYGRVCDIYQINLILVNNAPKEDRTFFNILAWWAIVPLVPSWNLFSCWPFHCLLRNESVVAVQAVKPHHKFMHQNKKKHIKKFLAVKGGHFHVKLRNILILPKNRKNWNFF